MDEGQRVEMTKDRGQRTMASVDCPLSSVPGNLLIPFAVHTAKFGYDWSNVPEGMTREELDACYRVAIERKPEYLAVGEVVSGVAEARGRKFVFSIQIAEAWDANGRNAEYGAFAFVPALVADRLYLDGLLARDEFRTPSRTPPTSVSCEIVRVPPVFNPLARPSAVPPPRLRPAPTVQEPPRPTPTPAVSRAPSAIDGETDWLTVLVWAASAIAALVAIIAACKG